MHAFGLVRVYLNAVGGGPSEDGVEYGAKGVRVAVGPYGSCSFWFLGVGRRGGDDDESVVYEAGQRLKAGVASFVCSMERC